MPTDIRSAFANMLHHTLFEKNGHLKGQFYQVIVDHPNQRPANRGPADCGPADRGPADHGPADRRSISY